MRTSLVVALGVAIAGAGAVAAGHRGTAVDEAVLVPAAPVTKGLPEPVARIGDMPVARVAPVRQDWPETPYNARFVFTRVRFDDGRAGMNQFFGRRGEPWWHHDHPSAEYNFAKILETLSYVPPTTDHSNIVALDDDRIFYFPILYMVEPGHWRATEPEMENLRAYLLKGGFLIVDDLDDRQMYVLAEIFRRVLPETPFVPIEPDDEVFDSFFAIDPVALNFHGAAYRGDHIDFWGIYEDNDTSKRLLVIAGNRGDLGEFWEFSDVGFFPIDITNEAYKVGVNYIVYAMTH